MITNRVMRLLDYMSPARFAGALEKAAVDTKTLNEIAIEKMYDPTWLREQAAVVTQQVDKNFSRGPNPFSGVIETVQLAFGDVLEVETREGIQVFSVAQGGYIDESQVKTSRFRSGKDTFGWHVTFNYDDIIRSGWTESIASLRALAVLKEETELLRRQYALLDAAVSSSSPYYVDGSGGLTKPMLDAAIIDVLDAPRYGGPMGSNSGITIIGRASAVAQIEDMPGFTASQAQLDDINALGYLGLYKSARVARLQNWTDEDYNSYFPNDELWVVSPGAGKFGLYGGSRPNAWAGNRTRTVHVDSRRDVGGVIHQPQIVRRIGGLD
jgi:hypothetical protein